MKKDVNVSVEVNVFPKEYALAYARHVTGYLYPCPWNPFPPNSPWGKAIEEAYRRTAAK